MWENSHSFFTDVTKGRRVVWKTTNPVTTNSSTYKVPNRNTKQKRPPSNRWYSVRPVTFHECILWQCSDSDSIGRPPTSSTRSLDSVVGRLVVRTLTPSLRYALVGRLVSMHSLGSTLVDLSGQTFLEDRFGFRMFDLFQEKQSSGIQKSTKLL